MELGRAQRLGMNQYLNLEYLPKDTRTRTLLNQGYATPASLFPPEQDVLRQACDTSLPYRWLLAMRLVHKHGHNIHRKTRAQTYERERK